MVRKYTGTSDKGHSKREQTSQHACMQRNLTYTLYKMTEDNLYTRDESLGPEYVHYSEVLL